MEHLQRVWHASRERLPFRTPGSVPILRLANAPIVETKFLELAMSLLDFLPRIPLGTFSILLILNLLPRVICVSQMHLVDSIISNNLNHRLSLELTTFLLNFLCLLHILKACNLHLVVCGFPIPVTVNKPVSVINQYDIFIPVHIKFYIL